MRVSVVGYEGEHRTLAEVKVEPAPLKYAVWAAKHPPVRYGFY